MTDKYEHANDVQTVMVNEIAPLFEGRCITPEEEGLYIEIGLRLYNAGYEAGYGAGFDDGLDEAGEG